MKKILQIKLKIFAKIMLWRYRPKVVAITGSVGKTSTKNAIFTILNSKYRVRKSYNSYNNQIGLPLTILGFKTPGKNIWGWLKIFWLSFLRIIYQKDYPTILVLEMGADRLGDISYLTSIAKPDIGVITNIGSSHLEKFGNKQNLIKEKTQLIKDLKKDGVAVLNLDDSVLAKVGLDTDKEVFFFGLSQEANFRADNIAYKNNRLTFKVGSGGNSVPVKLKALGRYQVYNILAAMSVGSIVGMDLVKMAEAVKYYQSEKGRLNILPGQKDTTIIDDSYNSAPESAKYALELLDEVSSGGNRRVAILGDMLELGKMSNLFHRDIARLATKKADLVIFVGDKAKIMAQEAKKFLASDSVKNYADYSSLNNDLLSIIKKGDIVLFKGSQGVRLDKSVRQLLSVDLNPNKVLVRQTEEWQNK